MKTVGAYEAKTHLAQLLNRVARGEEIQITRNGRPVARLIPDPTSQVSDVHAAIAAVRELRKVRRLGDDLTIRQLMKGGRRF